MNRFSSGSHWKSLDIVIFFNEDKRKEGSHDDDKLVAIVEFY